MTQDAKLNRRTRRLLEWSYIMSQGVPTSWNPMDRASGLRHKRPYQLKKASQALADHGISR